MLPGVECRVISMEARSLSLRVVGFRKRAKLEGRVRFISALLYKVNNGDTEIIAAREALRS